MPRFSSKTAGDFLNSFLQANAGQDIVRGLLTQRQLESSQLEDELARQKASAPPDPMLAEMQAQRLENERLLGEQRRKAIAGPGEQDPLIAQKRQQDLENARILYKLRERDLNKPASGGRSRGRGTPGADAEDDGLDMTPAKMQEVMYSLRQPIYAEEDWDEKANGGKGGWRQGARPAKWFFESPEDEAMFSTLMSELTQMGFYGEQGPYGASFQGVGGPATPAWAAPQGGDADFDYIPGRGLVPRGANAPR